MLLNREVVDAEGDIDGNKGSLKISEPQDPWTTNEKLKQAYPSMIRSHVWFDSLQRLGAAIFVEYSWFLRNFVKETYFTKYELINCL